VDSEPQAKLAADSMLLARLAVDSERRVRLVAGSKLQAKPAVDLERRGKRVADSMLLARLAVDSKRLVKPAADLERRGKRAADFARPAAKQRVVLSSKNSNNSSKLAQTDLSRVLDSYQLSFECVSKT